MNAVNEQRKIYIDLDMKLTIQQHNSIGMIPKWGNEMVKYIRDWFVLIFKIKN